MHKKKRVMNRKSKQLKLKKWIGLEKGRLHWRRKRQQLNKIFLMRREMRAVQKQTKRLKSNEKRERKKRKKTEKDES